VTVIANPGDGKEALTDRQRQVLDFIGRSIERRGYPPTLREIGEHMGIRSTNGVNDHLKALEKKGYLAREDLKSRALRPLDGRGGPTLPSSSEFLDVPLLGKVAAGQPILAVEDAEDTVRVDRFFLGRGDGKEGREVFALRVKGDSMIEAGIYDGDFLFVRKQADARRGDIVVAMIDGEATVKYYHPEGDTIVFRPANRAMGPIVVWRREWKSVNLLGIVIGVYRRLQ
jgi:repressor LexA